MIPQQDNFNDMLMDGVNVEIAPTFTHRMHVNSMRIYGHIDDKEALKQMIYKQLNTEYGDHIIYPNFGMPLKDLFGQPKHFAYIEVIRRIEECLIRDDRVLKVYDFYYHRDKSPRDELSISFTVDSVYGDIEVYNTWKFDYDKGIGGD